MSKRNKAEQEMIERYRREQDQKRRRILGEVESTGKANAFWKFSEPRDQWEKTWSAYYSSIDGDDYDPKSFTPAFNYFKSILGTFS